MIVLGLSQAQAADWASWRGPTQNGVAYETGLPDSCQDVLWKAPYGGRSTPIILNGRVFGINLAGKDVMEQERSSRWTSRQANSPGSGASTSF